jgi:hypothetical protein
MSANVGGALSHPASTFLSYTITQADKDTWQTAMGGFVEMADYTISMSVIHVHSVTSSMVTQIGYDGSTGTYTYQVAGTTPGTPGVYDDKFSFSDGHVGVHKDPDVGPLTKTVNVT